MSDYMTRLLNRHSMKDFVPTYGSIFLCAPTYRLAVLTLAECGDLIPDHRTLGAIRHENGETIT